HAAAAELSRDLVVRNARADDVAHEVRIRSDVVARKPGQHEATRRSWCHSLGHAFGQSDPARKPTELCRRWRVGYASRGRLGSARDLTFEGTRAAAVSSRVRSNPLRAAHLTIASLRTRVWSGVTRRTKYTPRGTRPMPALP